MFILFLISAFIGGYGFATKIKKEGSFIEYTAMGIGIGYIISGWITYLISYICKVMFSLEYPKIYGNTISILLMTAIGLFTLWKKKLNFNFSKQEKTELIGFFFLFIAIMLSMFYVFYCKDGFLHAGNTVFSDYAPHTAMIRSFAWHDNFPTQYAHYGGQDIKYHFMFQFLVGNLEFLGMRIDWAFNITSTASLWGFLVLLYYFAKEITGKISVGIISVFMFFCRSSFAVFEKLIDAIFSGTLKNFFENSTFIGYTAHEDWGLWNYNVFLNQRHLGLGLLIGIILIRIFAEYLNWLDTTEISVLTKAKTMLASKEGWIPENIKLAAFLGVLLGATSFWNGAVVVATLLILFVFAIFAKHKLDFAIMAAITLALSFLQTTFFMDNNTSTIKGIQFVFGFIADEKTFGGILIYLLKLSGIFFIGVIIFAVVLKGKKRIMTLAFMFPVIFAFTVSMTPDVTVNHKYIMISVMLLNIMWAYVLVKMFSGNIVFKTLSVTLLIALTLTGAYDILTIYNADKNPYIINTESKLTNWLKENVKENELVLVNQDSVSETSLSGVMMYNAWPYYAWSAGYDTDRRENFANMIFQAKNKDELKNMLKEENIDYIVIDKHNDRDDSLIKETFECTFNKNGDCVYKVN